MCLHLQANLKKFLDYVHAGAVDKLSKALEKGLDPNYHDTESGGETVKGLESLESLLVVILKNMTKLVAAFRKQHMPA